jgi:hypothetical protein
MKPMSILRLACQRSAHSLLYFLGSTTNRSAHKYVARTAGGRDESQVAYVANAMLC